MAAKYQLFGKLNDETYAALEADIAKRGVQVPIEMDDEGNVLDGHHRKEIADRLGKSYQTIARKFATEAEKREHVIKLNLARRHLEPWQWGQAFKMLLEERGITRGGGRKTPEQEGKAATVAALASEVGVSDRTARHRMSAADAFEALPAKAKKGVLKGSTTVVKAKRAEKDAERAAKEQAAKRRIKRAKTIQEALGSTKFATLVVDPPWDWDDEGDATQFGRGRTTYGAMSHEQLLAFPVGQYADKDAHLYLWITNRSLPKGFSLIEAWGFRYVTALTWCKSSIGMGNYFRGSTEFVLFGVRGSLPLKRKDVGTWFSAPRGKGHSAKPDEFYDLAESCSPGPYLDVFSRRDREGWVCWGGELS